MEPARQISDTEPRTVLVTGSSGMVGSALCERLNQRGDRVVRLVRAPAKAEDPDALLWNIDEGTIDQNGLEKAAPNAVVHLAGESVYALRWTEEKKRRIRESRTKGTALLSTALAGLGCKPDVLLSASASGIYGDHGRDPVTEESHLGAGFLSDVCRAWEAATSPAEDAGIRTVHMRIGVVLAAEGILLKRLVPLYKVGLGGHIGLGRRYMPWIALEDVIRAMLHLIDSELSGPVNLAAPSSADGREFGKALGNVLRRPSLFPVPPLLLALAGGQMAREIALGSIRLQPQRLLEDGFAFNHPQVQGALTSTLG